MFKCSHSILSVFGGGDPFLCVNFVIYLISVLVDFKVKMYEQSKDGSLGKIAVISPGSCHKWKDWC